MLPLVDIWHAISPYLTGLAPAVPYVSAGIAILSLVVANGSRKNAKKSLGIAQRAEARLQSEISIYLRQARQVVDGTGYFVIVSIDVTNHSSAPIWIKKASMWVEYLVDNQRLLSEIAAGALPASSGPPMALPLELKSRQVSSGVLAFHVSNARTNGRPILRQSLRLTDTDGNEWVLDDIKAAAS